MKVLGTNTFLYGAQLDKMREYGAPEHRKQFRIICKCRGVADANKKCASLGFHDRVFVRGWCCETGNATELALCEQEDIWVAVDNSIGRKYVSARELMLAGKE